MNVVIFQCDLDSPEPTTVKPTRRGICPHEAKSFCVMKSICGVDFYRRALRRLIIMNAKW